MDKGNGGAFRTFARSESRARIPDASDAGLAECTSTPGYGETGAVYVTERGSGGGRPGGSPWWGGSE